MTRRLPAILLATLLAACTSKQAPSTKAAAAPETARLSATNWTSKTELYLEYPPLVAGKTGRFAVHLTRLDNFKALASGRVEVQLDAERFTTPGPSSPGIFGVDVKPSSPGLHAMTLRVTTADWADTHALGPVMVFADEQAAQNQPSEKPKEETIAFSKEQQWSLDYASEVVRERALRESLRVPAQIITRAEGDAEVTVPFDGRLVANALPPPGTEVQRDQVLAQIVPPVANPADQASLELARAEAEAALSLARKELQRVQRLAEAGAIPARRIDEAQAAELTAAARLKAAQARIAQYESTRSASGGAESGAFLLRAPITGVVADSHATAGANVHVGEVIFRLVDVTSVYVEGKVPEAELARLSKISEAQLEVPGSTASLPLRRLVSTGRLVDPATRTVSILYEADNRTRTLAVGQAVTLRLLSSTAAQTAAVPESAVVDDGGRPVVFVQMAGETFTRRPVNLGASESGYVQVLSGVRPGERIVTRGAYLIRLSAMSSQVPAHGHVH